jgi:hypothetical protein
MTRLRRAREPYRVRFNCLLGGWHGTVEDVRSCRRFPDARLISPRHVRGKETYAPGRVLTLRQQTNGLLLLEVVKNQVQRVIDLVESVVQVPDKMGNPKRHGAHGREKCPHKQGQHRGLAVLFIRAKVSPSPAAALDSRCGRRVQREVRPFNHRCRNQPHHGTLYRPTE